MLVQKKHEQQSHHHNQKSHLYTTGLYWILRNGSSGNGGWPPRDIAKVSGWKSVQFLAHLTGKAVREVAVDLIEHSLHHDD